MDLSKEIMKGRSSKQQQQTVSGVLGSLMPPEASARFRKWFPVSKVLAFISETLPRIAYGVLHYLGLFGGLCAEKVGLCVLIAHAAFAHAREGEPLTASFTATSEQNETSCNGVCALCSGQRRQMHPSLQSSSDGWWGRWRPRRWTLSLSARRGSGAAGYRSRSAGIWSRAAAWACASICAR